MEKFKNILKEVENQKEFVTHSTISFLTDEEKKTIFFKEHPLTIDGLKDLLFEMYQKIETLRSNEKWD